MSDKFWDTIREQIAELKSARSADDVGRILSHERNPYGHETHAGGTIGFFAGSGGDDTVDDALDEAGWSYVWSKASYWWCMEAPDGSMITYVEGDIYPGDRR
jgi:hypothetical protein